MADLEKKVEEVEEVEISHYEELKNDPNARISIPMDAVDLTILEDAEILLPHEFENM